MTEPLSFIIKLEPNGPEISKLMACCLLLDSPDLNDQERARIVRYLADRYTSSETT